MKKLIFFTFICLMVLSIPLKLVAEPDSALITMEDAKLEQRAKAIGKQLRCLVCQNQTIDESDAPMANDLKKLVRKKLKEGNTDQEIIDFIHKRYGDFVLMNPPIKPSTYGLWFAPFVIFIIGGIIVFYYLKNNNGKSV